MRHTTIQRISCSRHRVCCWSLHSLPTHEHREELHRAHRQSCHGSHSDQAVLRNNRKFLPSCDSNTEKKVCCDRFTSSRQHCAVTRRQSPKRPEDGRCKDIARTNNSNISNAEPVNTVCAIYIPEVDRTRAMRRQNNV